MVPTDTSLIPWLQLKLKVTATTTRRELVTRILELKKYQATTISQHLVNKFYLMVTKSKNKDFGSCNVEKHKEAEKSKT